MNDPVVHAGPDEGYLKGLDTLIRVLEAAASSKGSAAACDCRSSGMCSGEDSI
jgi:hypothetical protein